MTKEQILKLTGLTEAEFYKKYPTKEAFYKDYPNAKRQMARGGSLNKDRMRTSTSTPIGAENYIFPAMYGVGEGTLNTAFPQYAPLTDALYKGIQLGVNPDKKEKRVQDASRGFGKVGGAVTVAAIDPSKINNAISQGITGLSSGIGNAVVDPETGEVIENIGTSIAPFAGLIPTGQKAYGGKMKFARGGNMNTMGSGVSSTGSLSAPGVDTSQLNQDKMRKKKTYLGGAAGAFAGIAAGLGDMIGLGPIIDKVNEAEGIETDGAFDTSRSITSGVGGAAMGIMGSVVGASGGKKGGGSPVSTAFSKAAKSTGQITPKLIQSGFNAQDALKKIQQIQGTGQQTSYVPGMYDTGVYTAMNGGMYRDGGVMHNTGNLGLTDLKGPRHADGGIALNEDVEVEGEETIYTPERYVFSEVMKASKDALKEAGLSPSYAGRSYSSISRSFKNSVDTLRGSEDKLAQRAVDKKLKKLIDAHEVDRAIKRERDSKNVVAQTPEEKAGGYNMFPDAESIMFPGQGQATVVPADNQMPIEVTGADGSQQILTNSPIQTQAPFMERKMAAGGMLKRADGSYSKRGLWDNIRAKAAANRRAGKKGKKPTKEMLEQEAKIRAAEKAMGGYMYDDGGGYFMGDGSDQDNYSFWKSSDDMSYMYGGDMMYGGDVDSYPQEMASGGKWIQKAVKGMRKDKPCTGSKFGGPTCPPGSKRYNLAKTFRKMAKSKKAEGGKLPEGILRARLESHMSPSEVEDYMESYAYGGNLGRTNYDIYVNSPSYFRAEGGSFDNPGFKALPEYVQNKIKSNMQDGGELYMGEAPEYEDMEGYELDEDEATNFGEGGSYRVYRTSERKGKTHKVVGPGGKVKYFGDPKMGERSKSKYGKKAFYARHRKNLAKNPFFRAYARATWEDGGYTSLTPQGLSFTPTISRKTGGEFGSPDNNYYYSDASGSYLNAMQQGGMMPMGAPEQAAPNQGDQMQQIMQAVAQMLQETQDPAKVAQALVQEGLSKEDAGQIVQTVLQQMQQAASANKQAGTLGQPQMGMQEAPQMGAPMMAYGGPMQYKKGGIYIKPSKRGSFTAWAKRKGMGVQEAARHVMANKEDYSSAIVKKANFAKNAAGWKHAMGGRLKYQQDLGSLPEYGPINDTELVNEPINITSMDPVLVPSNFRLDSNYIDASPIIGKENPFDENTKGGRDYFRYWNYVLRSPEFHKDEETKKMRYATYNPSTQMYEDAKQLPSESELFKSTLEERKNELGNKKFFNKYNSPYAGGLLTNEEVETLENFYKGLGPTDAENFKYFINNLLLDEVLPLTKDEFNDLLYYAKNFNNPNFDSSTYLPKTGRMKKLNSQILSMIGYQRDQPNRMKYPYTDYIPTEYSSEDVPATNINERLEPVNIQTARPGIINRKFNRPTISFNSMLGETNNIENNTPIPATTGKFAMDEGLPIDNPNQTQYFQTDEYGNIISANQMYGLSNTSRGVATPVVNQPVVTNAGPNTTTSGAAQRMMQTYFPNPLLKNTAQQTTAQQPLTGFPLLSYGVTKEGQEAQLRPYRSSIAPYIAGGIGSAVGPIANIIAASAIPDATYTAPAKMQRLGYTPVALARQQANQAIASTREGMRMGAPTQGSYLSNLAVSLPTTAAQTGQLVAKTRYGIDAANVEIANQEALNAQAVAQENAKLKDLTIGQRWNLGLAGAEGIGRAAQGLTRDLTQKAREEEMLRGLSTSDFANLKIVQDPNDPTKFRYVPSYTGSATYSDAQGNQIVTGADGKRYMVIGNTLKEIV